jgi:hypothetical protein
MKCLLPGLTWTSSGTVVLVPLGPDRVPWDGSAARTRSRLQSRPRCLARNMLPGSAAQEGPRQAIWSDVSIGRTRPRADQPSVRLQPVRAAPRRPDR